MSYYLTALSFTLAFVQFTVVTASTFPGSKPNGGRLPAVGALHEFRSIRTSSVDVTQCKPGKPAGEACLAPTFKSRRERLLSDSRNVTLP